MAFQIYGGKFLVVGGKFAVDPACCCEPPSCGDVTISMTIGTTTFPEATLCSSCSSTEVTHYNEGPAYWDFHRTAGDGWTYAIYSKPGFPGSCQNCDPETFDNTGYVSRGSMSGSDTFLRIGREAPGSCDDNNDRCWWIVATHDATGYECYLCPESTADENDCLSCCSATITTDGFTCTPSGGGGPPYAGVGSQSASFEITIPTYDTDPDCPDIFGDGSGVTWELSIDGVVVASGTGTIGSGGGDGSCSCDTPSPCFIPGAGVTLTYCYGGACCTVNG